MKITSRMKDIAARLKKYSAYDMEIGEGMRGMDKTGSEAHYDIGDKPTWDFIIAKKMPYCDGCVVKYICRWRHKGTPMEDLKKCRNYVNKLIEEEEKRSANVKDSPGPNCGCLSCRDFTWNKP